jgi:D-apionolactonase
MRTLRAGRLTAVLDGVDLRYIRLGDVELVRRIYVAVRDRNWNTIYGVASALEVNERDDSFEARFSVRHTSEDTDFTWSGSIVGSADGRIAYTMDGSAERDMLYNRVGFCVLQPWREYAGRPYRGTTPDGLVTGEFPLLVAPQSYDNGVYVPLFPSVSGLEVDVADGTTAVVEFEGDLFETEDQRNWTDASFKTYCTPLALGFPKELKRGETRSQAVTVSASGGTEVVAGLPAPRLEVGAETGAHVPPVGLAAAEGNPSEADLELLRLLAPAHVRVDVHLDQPGWRDRLAGALALCEVTRAALELALFLGEADAFAELREALAGADVARVLVVPEGAQTTTPEETTPAGLVTYARDELALDGVPFAGGTDMYFTELNRTRPQVEQMDGVFWSLNGQVHASDDVSLLETPEAQGEQVRTAQAFAGGKVIFVGPVTLKRRYNVNATVAEAKPDPPDPRQAMQIAAAWTAASAKHLAEQGAAAITYFETTGPAGVADGGEPFPVHRVLAEICRLRGAEILACETTRPLDVAGLAVRHEGTTTLLAANLTPAPQTVELRGLESTDRIDLAPYEVVRIDA